MREPSAKATLTRRPSRWTSLAMTFLAMVPHPPGSEPLQRTATGPLDVPPRPFQFTAIGHSVQSRHRCQNARLLSVVSGLGHGGEPVGSPEGDLVAGPGPA